MQKVQSLFSKFLTSVARIPHINIVGLIAAMGAYSALVVSHISSWSIWFDEAFTAYLVRFNYFDIAHYTATDVHPPLYYWVAKAWTSMFGTTELAFRSLSMVFGVVAIGLGFVLLRKLFDTRTALLGAWFMALSPMFIRYGEEARMYTMVTVIVLAATYMLVKATESNARKYWIWYGVLIALGMWTHYFAALAWIAHWVWRTVSLRVVDGYRGKELAKRFFTKSWIWTHVLALVVFAAWAPFMVKQLGIIQMGFWIPAVSAHTFTNYFTNVLFYLEQHQVQSWFAMLYVAIVICAGLLLYRACRSTRVQKRDHRYLLLLISLAFTPPVLLFIASMPPLKASFVERYLIPASTALMLLLAVVIVRGARSGARRLAVGAAILLIVAFGIGINRVYYYGNYNKNSGTSIRTKELIAAIDRRAEPGEPLIATDPWVFYEAVFYTSADHPVYFLDQTTEYKYGSTDMLKYNDQFKIKDLNAFLKDHPKVWYFGNVGSGEVNPPSIARGWQKIDAVSAYDPIDNKYSYKAVEYQTSAE